MKPIYQRVESIRVAHGVTKTHVAKSCGKSAAWYSDVSKGKIRLTVDDLEKIADALNVNVVLFFGYQLSETRNFVS